MNYLAHTYVSEGQSPEFIFGSVAPDLAGIAGAELRIRKGAELDSPALSDPDLQIQAGIAFHYLTDSVFDKNDVFRGLKRHYLKEIAPKYFDEEFRQARAIADLGTEMLLDGVVAENFPEAIEQYQSALSSVKGPEIARSSRKRILYLIALMGRYQKGLPDYTDPEVIASIYYRRTKDREKLSIQESQVGSIAESLADQKIMVDEVGVNLIESTKTVARKKSRYVQLRHLYQRSESW